MKSAKKQGAPSAPRNYRKEVSRGDITVEAAIKEVKDEMIDEVRALAGGYQQSVAHLINHLGKELLELEKMLAEALPSKDTTTKLSTKKSAARGIAPLAETDEIGEDDF